MLRGSGIKWDLRKAQPYDAYDKVEFDVEFSEIYVVVKRFLVIVVKIVEVDVFCVVVVRSKVSLF